MDTANFAILHLIYENKSFLGWEGVGVLMTSVLLSTTFDFMWVATVERHKILLFVLYGLHVSTSRAEALCFSC